MKGIADTGFLVAFCNGRDRRHDWAAFHVQDVLLVLNLVNDRLVAVGFDCRDHLPQLTALDERPFPSSVRPSSVGLRPTSTSLFATTWGRYDGGSSGHGVRHGWRRS